MHGFLDGYEWDHPTNVIVSLEYLPIALTQDCQFLNRAELVQELFIFAFIVLCKNLHLGETYFTHIFHL